MEMAQFERLPTDVVPVNYKVELQPDLEKFSFDGRLDITAKVTKPTRRVVLNCAEISVISCTVEGQVATVTCKEEIETIWLDFETELCFGEVHIIINYTGTLNDQMRGFYRSKYIINGEERYLAVSLFESADARRALPCWDEPAFKATFDVVLTVPKDRVALSNMNEIGCEDVEEDLKRVTFARTPIMSTYLLAFVVGEFDYVEERDANGVLVRVYTPVGKAEQGRFALELAVRTLPFYADYFEAPYPLNKMDLIAIPDFACGAMENWGLVTYREPRLLIDPNNSSNAVKKDVALVVGHELAHQWFGNLVTMEWWTHLWLNEGFATWIEYLCVDHTHPEFDIWTNFLSLEYAQAMSLDALANSHPIEVPVKTPAEAEEMFDVISYRKGACIIRMLYDWIGGEKFREGLRSYLKTFAYKNAATEDLWEHLAKASGSPVAEVMSAWTQKLGYPVLSVEGKQEGKKRVLTITQKKFCADGKLTGFESLLWHVPVTIATSNNPTAMKFVLDKCSDTITVEGVGPNDWILVNPGRQGFYRVSYSGDMFSSLSLALKKGQLSPEDRLGLQNDAFALARAGSLRTTEVMRLFASYVNETSYTVWESLASNLSVLDRLMSYSDCYEDFRKYAVKLFKPVAAKLGWEPKDSETPLDVMLRSLVIGQLGRYGDRDTIAEAQKRFGDHCCGVSQLPADLKTSVFSICLANGDSSTFDQLLKLHDATDSNEERVRIYHSLGNGNTDELTSRCMEFSLSEKVRNNDTQMLFSSAASAGPRAREVVWQFMKDKWSVLTKRYPGQNSMQKIIEATVSGFVSEEKAAEIEQFFKDHRWEMADKLVKQCCEAIQLHASWLKRDADSVKDWLTQAN